MGGITVEKECGNVTNIYDFCPNKEENWFAKDFSDK